MIRIRRRSRSGADPHVDDATLAMLLSGEEFAAVAQATEQVFSYFPVLHSRADEPAGNLSGGEQQMLTLGQAFLSRPRLLMIDELSLGLAPAVVEQLLEIVRAIHDRLVEGRMAHAGAD